MKRGGKTWTDYKFLHQWLWLEWGFTLRHEWYDGPFWQLWVGPFCCVWSLDGLPHIFQEEVK